MIDLLTDPLVLVPLVVALAIIAHWFGNRAERLIHVSSTDTPTKRVTVEFALYRMDIPGLAQLALEQIQEVLQASNSSEEVARLRSLGSRCLSIVFWVVLASCALVWIYTGESRMLLYAVVNGGVALLFAFALTEWLRLRAGRQVAVREIEKRTSGQAIPDRQQPG